MEIEVRHLRMLEAIAEAGSVTKAAVALAMSQPALTAQLQRIERMVGGELFQRDRNGARPTALGEVVLSHARSVLPVVDDLQRSVRQHRQGVTPRTVRVGATPGPLASPMAVLLPEILPRCEVELRVSPLRQPAVELLAGGRLELVICADVPTHPMTLPDGLANAVVATEPVFVAVASSHPCAGEAEVDLGSLAGERWLMSEDDDPGFTDHVRAACAEAGFTLPGLQGMDFSVGVELVTLGKAIMLVQATCKQRSGIVYLPIRDNPVQQRQVLVWRENGPFDQPVVDKLLVRLEQTYWALAEERAPVYTSWLDRHGRMA